MINQAQIAAELNLQIGQTFENRAGQKSTISRMTESSVFVISQTTGGVQRESYNTIKNYLAKGSLKPAQ